MKRFYLIGVICMLCGLVGCNSSNKGPEQNFASSAHEKSREVNLTQTEKPPSLTITIGKKVIKTMQGGYSWSYSDSNTGQIVYIEADSMPPTELVNVEDAVSVSLSEPITLNFEKKPLNYEIRVYDNRDVRIATHDSFKHIKEKGKAIYEIWATWEEGTSSYAVALAFENEDCLKNL